MTDERRGQLIAGVALVLIGALLAGRQVFGWHALEFDQVWPIIVIAWGAHKCWDGLARRNGTAGWGISLMLNGIILLMHTEGVMPLRRSWPLFVVAHGIGMFLGGLTARRGRPRAGVDAGEVRDDR